MKAYESKLNRKRKSLVQVNRKEKKKTMGGK